MPYKNVLSRDVGSAAGSKETRIYSCDEAAIAAATAAAVAADDATSLLCESAIFRNAQLLIRRTRSNRLTIARHKTELDYHRLEERGNELTIVSR